MVKLWEGKYNNSEMLFFSNLSSLNYQLNYNYKFEKESLIYCPIPESLVRLVSKLEIDVAWTYRTYSTQIKN